MRETCRIKSLLLLLLGLAVLSILTSLRVSTQQTWMGLTYAQDQTIPGVARNASQDTRGEPAIRRPNVPPQDGTLVLRDSVPVDGAKALRTGSSPRSESPALDDKQISKPSSDLEDNDKFSAEVLRVRAAWKALMMADSAESPVQEFPNVNRHKAQNATDPTNEVTLVSFGSMDQLLHIPRLVTRWSGPISLALHVPDEDSLTSFSRFYHEKLSTFQNISIHFLLEKGASDKGVPGNRLRNLAMQAVESDYLLFLDLEYLPSADLHARLMVVLRTNYRVRAVLDELRLLVLPAFEWANNTFSGMPLDGIPAEKTDLVHRVRDGSVLLTPMPNVSQVAASMDYAKWAKSTPGNMYILPGWKPAYAPFVLARREGLPPFFERFRNPWYATQSWFEELYEGYYTVGILREFFAFRVGAKAAWEKPLDDSEYQLFRKYLHETYVEDPTLRTVTAFSSSKRDRLCVPTELLVPHNSSLELLEVEQALLCEWQTFKSSSDYRRQIPNVLVPSRGATEDHILSLALHGSVDRLDRLLDGIKRWKGPASVAIYVKNSTTISEFFGFFRQEQNVLANVSFHFFFEKILRERDHLYPHNYLRNLALESSNAEYVISCDMDFATHQDAHSQLVKLLLQERDVRNLLDKHTVLVLPAFESRLGVASETFVPPVDKASLMRYVSEKLAEPFHVRKYSAGHGPTNFTKWLNHENNIKGATYEIPYEWGFEPYVLAKRLELPKFWTPFRGFGFNKQSWYEELDRRGYRFSVLRDFFVFHVGASSGRVETPDWVHNEYQRKFRPYLDRHYPRKDA